MREPQDHHGALRWEGERALDRNNMWRSKQDEACVEERRGFLLVPGEASLRVRTSEGVGTESD